MLFRSVRMQHVPALQCLSLWFANQSTELLFLFTACSMEEVFRKAFHYISFKVFTYSDCIQVAECISIQCITAVQLFRYSISYNEFQYCPALPVAYDILWTRRANMSLIGARDFWASVHPFLHLSLTIINSCCGLQPEGGRG